MKPPVKLSPHPPLHEITTERVSAKRFITEHHVIHPSFLPSLHPFIPSPPPRETRPRGLSTQEHRQMLPPYTGAMQRHDHERIVTAGHAQRDLPDSVERPACFPHVLVRFEHRCFGICNESASRRMRSADKILSSEIRQLLGKPTGQHLLQPHDNL